MNSQCQHCQTTFDLKPTGKGGFYSRKFCTTACKSAAYRQLNGLPIDTIKERLCLSCGTPIPVIRTRIGSTAKRTYCSTPCKKRDARKRSKAQNPDAVKAKRRREWEATRADPLRLEKHNGQFKKNHGKVLKWLADYKVSHGCVDCGYNEYAAALQLDHEGFKSVEIRDARSSVARLQAEIEAGKCVVRCANCHSVITWKRKVGLA